MEIQYFFLWKYFLVEERVKISLFNVYLHSFEESFGGKRNTNAGVQTKKYGDGEWH